MFDLLVSSDSSFGFKEGDIESVLVTQEEIFIKLIN